MFEGFTPQDEQFDEGNENRLETGSEDIFKEIGVPADLSPDVRAESVSEAILEHPPELQVAAIEMVVEDAQEIKADSEIVKILRNIIKTDLGRGLEQGLKDKIVDLAYEIDDVDLQKTLLVELEKAGILVRKYEAPAEPKRVETTKKKSTPVETVEEVEVKEFDFSGEFPPEGWRLDGDAYLTGYGEVDEQGSGWLRLTEDVEKQHGIALFDEPIETKNGLSFQFDYTSWSKGYGGGSGMVFFLIDGKTDYVDFEPGAAHGNLGYAPKWNGQGMTNAVLGVALDVNGNFSKENNTRPGGPGQVKDSISVRAGENAEVPFEYIAGTEKLSDKKGNHGINVSNQETRPEQDGEDYRHVNIQLKSAEKSFLLDVSIQMGVSNEPEKVLENVELPMEIPETVKFGFSATTTGATGVQEIKNVEVQEDVPSQEQETKVLQEKKEEGSQNLNSKVIIEERENLTPSIEEDVSNQDINQESKNIG